MTDIWDKNKRSNVMSRIRSKNTKPEILLRSLLFKHGFRFRIHVKDLPGKPDIVLKKYKTVIFVHGCFWHYHKDCNEGRIPTTNSDFWKRKLLKTIERDKLHQETLKELGWNVIILWECEINKMNNNFLINKIICDLSRPQLKNDLILKVYENIHGEITKVSEEIISYETMRKALPQKKQR